jgi:hypothetical protein
VSRSPESRSGHVSICLAAKFSPAAVDRNPDWTYSIASLEPVPWLRGRECSGFRCAGCCGANGHLRVSAPGWKVLRTAEPASCASQVSARRLASSNSSDSPSDLYWCRPSRPRNPATHVSGPRRKPNAAPLERRCQ